MTITESQIHNIASYSNIIWDPDKYNTLFLRVIHCLTSCLSLNNIFNILHHYFPCNQTLFEILNQKAWINKMCLMLLKLERDSVHQGRNISVTMFGFGQKKVRQNITFSL